MSWQAADCRLQAGPKGPAFFCDWGVTAKSRATNKALVPADQRLSSQRF